MKTKAINHLSFFLSKRDSLYVGLIFACNSFIFGNWVARIPIVKSDIGLSEAELGLALLGAPVGAMCIMPFAGWIISRLTLGKALVASSLLHIATLPLLALAGRFWELAAMLWIFGLTNAIMDISMNEAAAQVERQLKRPIMSTCHGFWSVGAMLGAGIGSLIVGWTPNTMLHLSVSSILIFFFAAYFSSRLLHLQEAKKVGEKVFALPKGTLLVLALLAFCIMLSEGAIADWSGVYMREVIKSSDYLIGLAYAGFALLMTVGRLSGDAIIPMYGKRKVIIWGGLTAAIGLALALLADEPVQAIVGFSFAGIGYSCIIPIVFISAANEPGYASGTGLAAVTSVGYIGFLIGPPIIGLLSDWYGLPVGLCFVLGCSLLVSVVSLAVKFR